MDSYKLISDHYGDRKAKRSGFPLIKHIDDGLAIINEIMRKTSVFQHGIHDDKVHQLVNDVWCLHPLGQEKIAIPDINEDQKTLLDQYVYYANSLLRSNYKTNSWIDLPETGVLWTLLATDKIQNYIDFLEIDNHNPFVYEERVEIREYFEWWLKKLHIPKIFWGEE